MSDAALGCAIYFETDLSEDATALQALWGKLASGASVPLTQWVTAEKTQQVGKPRPFDAASLRTRIERGEAASAAMETAPRTADDEQLLVLAQTTPRPNLRPGIPRQWTYSVVIAVGAQPLARLGASQVVDAVVELADRVAVTAGVMHWAETTSFAGALAMGAGGGLTPERERRVSDALYWRSEWGRIVRGPAWGTFLGAAHVKTLGSGSMDALETICTRVMRLDCGGAFLQLTDTDAPLLDTEESTQLRELEDRLLAVRPSTAS